MMKTKRNVNITNGNSKVFFAPSLYNDTMKLLTEARDYFSACGSHDQSHMNTMGRMVYSSEMARITLRLSTVMAWVLARKAVIAGQMCQTEAAKNFQLQFKDECLTHTPNLQTILPGYVVELLEKTHALYQRVAHLDNAATAKA